MFDKALAIDPNYAYALIGKGVSLDNLGRPEEAITYYDKALAIDPNDVNALNSKGVSHGKLGRYEEAITYYDKALAIDPDKVSALNNYCTFLVPAMHRQSIFSCNKIAKVPKVLKL